MTEVKVNLSAVSWEFPVLKEYNLILVVRLELILKPNEGQVQS